MDRIGFCGNRGITERGVRGLARTVPLSGFGESHCEGRTRLGRRTHLNVPAVCRDDRSRDEQAKADAVRGRLHGAASERFEYRWQCVFRNRWATVLDRERYGVTLLLSGKSDGCSAAMLYRVGEQIRHDLCEPVGIPLAMQIARHL